MVRPKKSLGQHFLSDENIARKIIAALPEDTVNLIEIGPGTGMLTKYLLKLPQVKPFFNETDHEAWEFLTLNFPENKNRFIHADFLKTDISQLFDDSVTIMGNFPYNISSQIFFRVLENRNRVNHVICMIQKEVAERISSPPGSKSYGILSVLLQAYYDIRYLFTVSEHVFFPPPKVKSGVIHLQRNAIRQLHCDEAMFYRVVKTAFNQRRKTLRNSLKSTFPEKAEDHPLLAKRPEQLSVNEFVILTQLISPTA